MKAVQLFSGALFLTAAVFLSSCEKDTVRRSTNKTVNGSDSTAGDSAAPSAVVINALGTDGQVVDIALNGNRIVNDLGLQEVTKYIDLDEGQVTLSALSQDGHVLASSNVNLLKGEVYNIVLNDGTNGQPRISVLSLDLINFQGQDLFSDLMKLTGNPADLSGLNFLDLTNGTLPTEQLLGADFINKLGDTIPGLLNLTPGQFSDPIFGNGDVLESLNMLNSTLSYEDLVKQLQGTGGSTNFPELGDFVALLTENPGGLLDFLQNSILDLLGGGSNPLTPVTGNLIDPNTLIPGHDYTGILTGDKNNPVFMLIDQTVAGLPQQ